MNLIGLINFSTYNSIPNIDKSNNAFCYKDNSTYKTIYLPEGNYEIDNINNFLQLQLGNPTPQNDNTYNVTLLDDDVINM